jgi:hypothetical protein
MRLATPPRIQALQRKLRLQAKRCANALRKSPIREPGAGNPHVRFDEREVETEHGRRILRHRRGNPETEVSRSLHHRATSRLYRVFSPKNAASAQVGKAIVRNAAASSTALRASSLAS